MSLCGMLPALKIVAAVGIRTMRLNHSILSNASAVHSFTARLHADRLENLKERHICYMRQPELNGLCYYSMVY